MLLLVYTTFVLLIKECGAHSVVWLSLIYLFTSKFL